MKQPVSNDVESDPAAAMEKLMLFDPNNDEYPPLPSPGDSPLINQSNSGTALTLPTDTFYRQVRAGRSLPTENPALRQ